MPSLGNFFTAAGIWWCVISVVIGVIVIRKLMEICNIFKEIRNLLPKPKPPPVSDPKSTDQRRCRCWLLKPEMRMKPNIIEATGYKIKSHKEIIDGKEIKIVDGVELRYKR